MSHGEGLPVNECARTTAPASLVGVCGCRCALEATWKCGTGFQRTFGGESFRGGGEERGGLCVPVLYDAIAI